MRLGLSTFEAVSRARGPFSSYLGAERGHALVGADAAAGSDARSAANEPARLWAHPTFNTVGTALRRIEERLEGGGEASTTSVALVPRPSGERWNTLMKHGVVIGRFGRDSACFEMSTMGSWRSCGARRPMVLVLFPRAAGASPRPLALTMSEGLQPVAEASSERATGSGVMARASSWE